MRNQQDIATRQRELKAMMGLHFTEQQVLEAAILHRQQLLNSGKRHDWAWRWLKMLLELYQATYQVDVNLVASVQADMDTYAKTYLTSVN